MQRYFWDLGNGVKYTILVELVCFGQKELQSRVKQKAGEDCRQPYIMNYVFGLHFRYPQYSDFYFSLQ